MLVIPSSSAIFLISQASKRYASRRQHNVRDWSLEAGRCFMQGVANYGITRSAAVVGVNRPDTANRIFHQWENLEEGFDILAKWPEGVRKTAQSAFRYWAGAQSRCGDTGSRPHLAHDSGSSVSQVLAIPLICERLAVLLSPENRQFCGLTNSELSMSAPERPDCQGS